MDSGLLYRVYQKQGKGPITLGVTSLDRFLQISINEIFFRTFLKNCKGNKVETWYIHGERVDVSSISESQPRAHNSWS